MARNKDDELPLHPVLGVPFLPERAPVADLLVRACDNLGYLDGGKKPLRALGDGTGRSPQLYAGWLKTRALPQLQTLRDLQSKAGIALEDWLVAFRLIPPRERAVGSVDSLSPALQDVIAVSAGLTEDVLRELARLMRLLLAQGQADRRGDGRPTDAGT